MPKKLGACTACRRPIYSSDGPADACGCDDGVLNTLQLREGTPVTQLRRANGNGDALPMIDMFLFLSPAGQAELAGAQATLTRYDVTYPEDSVLVEETPFVEESLGISFDAPEFPDYPTARPNREGRFRVDHGLPAREPFAGRVASGPSDGRVVGRVGQIGREVPVYTIGQENPVDYIPAQQHSTPLPVVRPLSTRRDPVPVRTALERLGEIEINEDPFR